MFAKFNNRKYLKGTKPVTGSRPHRAPEVDCNSPFFIEDMADQERVAIQQAIKDQGEIVRKLKADKAEKDKVN